MKKKRAFWNAGLASIGILILILDAKTALEGAKEGLAVCTQTVVPSLFPFFIMSSLLTGNISAFRSKQLAWLGKALGIPHGAELIWITGLLGGYPIGAKCVCQAFEDGSIDRDTASRMLGFCSNAGPAFIFGMTAVFFPGNIFPWLLFCIQLLSSLITGVFLPGRTHITATHITAKNATWNDALQSALRGICSVCGWIILFRVILNMSSRWFLWLLPDPVRVLLTGITELSNGILALNQISSEAERFILCSALLSFGGLCVAMQTAAVTGSVGLGAYFSGKLFQTAVSVFLASAACTVLYGTGALYCLGSAAISFGFLLHFYGKKKKTVAIRERLVYNG